MKNKNTYLFYCLLILVAIQFSHVRASNKVVVAAVGGRVITQRAPDKTEPQELVNEVIEFWKGKLNNVLPDKPDLILLPEYCDLPKGLTGESQFDYYKARKNQVMEYFSSVSKANHCYIAFGTAREVDGKWTDSCVLLDREGKIAGIYDKNFPTIYEMENGFIPGNEAPIFQCDFGRVACAICFDLNFDELRNRYSSQKPDIILFPTMYHGGLEQSNWAYSCQSFLVSACSPQNIPSEIRNPLGEVIASSTNYFNYVVTRINLDRELVHLDYNFKKLDSLKKKYGFGVLISDPGRLGVVMITSNIEGVTAKDMIKEFKIELVDDYFNRTEKKRALELQ